MRTHNSSLPNIPWPLLAAGTLILIALLSTLISAIQPLLAFAAVMSWLLLGTSIVYRAGYAPWLSQVPYLSTLLYALVSSGTHDEGADADQRALPDDPAERSRVGTEAQAILSELLGQEQMREAVRGLLTIAEETARRGLAGLGADRAAIILMYGPRGTGKSTAARALADLLFASGASGLRKVIECEAPADAALPSTSDREWRARLEQSIDGVLLVDDADWLDRTNELGGSKLSAQLFRLVDQYGTKHRGRVIVLITTTSAGPSVVPEFLGDHETERLLDRHRVFVVPFASLADAHLLSIFRSRLASRHGLGLAPGAEADAERLLREERKTRGDEFENAEAARRLAEQAASWVALRRGDAVGVEDLARIRA